jgi:hypothetical protein
VIRHDIFNHEYRPGLVTRQLIARLRAGDFLYKARGIFVGFALKSLAVGVSAPR